MSHEKQLKNEEGEKKEGGKSEAKTRKKRAIRKETLTSHHSPSRTQPESNKPIPEVQQIIPEKNWEALWQEYKRKKDVLPYGQLDKNQFKATYEVIQAFTNLFVAADPLEKFSESEKSNFNMSCALIKLKNATHQEQDCLIIGPSGKKDTHPYDAHESYQYQIQKFVKELNYDNSFGKKYKDLLSVFNNTLSIYQNTPLFIVDSFSPQTLEDLHLGKEVYAYTDYNLHLISFNNLPESAELKKYTYSSPLLVKVGEDIFLYSFQKKLSSESGEWVRFDVEKSRFQNFDFPQEVVEVEAKKIDPDIYTYFFGLNYRYSEEYWCGEGIIDPEIKKAQQTSTDNKVIGTVHFRGEIIEGKKLSQFEPQSSCWRCLEVSKKLGDPNKEKFEFPLKLFDLEKKVEKKLSQSRLTRVAAPTLVFPAQDNTDALYFLGNDNLKQLIKAWYLINYDKQFITKKGGKSKTNLELAQEAVKPFIKRNLLPRTLQVILDPDISDNKKPVTDEQKKRLEEQGEYAKKYLVRRWLNEKKPSDDEIVALINNQAKSVKDFDRHFEISFVDSTPENSNLNTQFSTSIKNILLDMKKNEWREKAEKIINEGEVKALLVLASGDTTNEKHPLNSLFFQRYNNEKDKKLFRSKIGKESISKLKEKSDELFDLANECVINKDINELEDFILSSEKNFSSHIIYNYQEGKKISEAELKILNNEDKVKLKKNAEIEFSIKFSNTISIEDLIKYHEAPDKENFIKKDLLTPKFPQIPEKINIDILSQELNEIIIKRKEELIRKASATPTILGEKFTITAPTDLQSPFKNKETLKQFIQYDPKSNIEPPQAFIEVKLLSESELYDAKNIAKSSLKSILYDEIRKSILDLKGSSRDVIEENLKKMYSEYYPDLITQNELKELISEKKAFLDEQNVFSQKSIEELIAFVDKNPLRATELKPLITNKIKEAFHQGVQKQTEEQSLILLKSISAYIQKPTQDQISEIINKIQGLPNILTAQKNPSQFFSNYTNYDTFKKFLETGVIELSIFEKRFNEIYSSNKFSLTEKNIKAIMSNENNEIRKKLVKDINFKGNPQLLNAAIDKLILVGKIKSKETLESKLNNLKKIDIGNIKTSVLENLKDFEASSFNNYCSKKDSPFLLENDFNSVKKHVQKIMKAAKPAQQAKNFPSPKEEPSYHKMLSTFCPPPMITSNLPNIASKKGLSLSTDTLNHLIELPDEFGIGKAIDNGGCFFDALAQILNENLAPGSQPYTEKVLRIRCKELYENLSKEEKKQFGEEKDYTDVEYTFEDAEEYGDKVKYTWGDWETHGKLLLNKMKGLDSLCIIQLQSDDGMTWGSHCTTMWKNAPQVQNASKLETKQFVASGIPTLIFQGGVGKKNVAIGGHYVPILKYPNLQDTFTISDSSTLKEKKSSDEDDLAKKALTMHYGNVLKPDVKDKDAQEKAKQEKTSTLEDVKKNLPSHHPGGGGNPSSS